MRNLYCAIIVWNSGKIQHLKPQTGERSDIVDKVWDLIGTKDVHVSRLIIERM